MPSFPRKQAGIQWAGPEHKGRHERFLDGLLGRTTAHNRANSRAAVAWFGSTVNNCCNACRASAIWPNRW